MRVISGTARHTQLVTPKGDDTRPTTDRIKETLFNIIRDDIVGVRFLDIFAGSGGIGIEALSRGASEAVFIDSGAEAIRCIHTNISKTHMEDRARVIRSGFQKALERLAADDESFEVIFADPPYEAGYEEKLLDGIGRFHIARQGALIILEAGIDTQVDDICKLTGYEITRIKEYKTNKHIFLRYR